MAAKLICDRCGAEINPKSSVTYAGMRERKNDINDNDYELCVSCAHKLRVLQVVENLVKGAPDIGPRQYGNKMLAAKNMALKFELESTNRRIEEHMNAYRRSESTNALLPMGFYKGLVTAEQETRNWLERMVQDGGAQHG